MKIWGTRWEDRKGGKEEREKQRQTDPMRDYENKRWGISTQNQRDGSEEKGRRRQRGAYRSRD